MAIQFLTAVNETMKRVGMIAGSDGELESFEVTDGRQASVDRMIQIWNETLRLLYNTSGEPFPTEQQQSTITLVDQQREYDLPTDLERINWPLNNDDDGQVIRAFGGGFQKMRIIQRQPDNWTGLPIWAAINPINGKLRMYTIPQADDGGRIYQLYYEKRLTLQFTNDTFPFSDTIVEELYSPVAAVWRADKGEGIDELTARRNLSIAASLLSKQPLRQKY
jgi:hypothetical protein